MGPASFSRMTVTVNMGSVLVDIFPVDVWSSLKSSWHCACVMKPVVSEAIFLHYKSLRIHILVSLNHYMKITFIWLVITSLLLLSGCSQAFLTVYVHGTFLICLSLEAGNCEVNWCEYFECLIQIAETCSVSWRPFHFVISCRSVGSTPYWHCNSASSQSKVEEDTCQIYF